MGKHVRTTSRRKSTQAPALLDERCIAIALVAAAGVFALGMYNGVNPVRVLTISIVDAVLACICAIPLYWKVDTGGARWLSPALVVSGAFALYYGIGNVPCSLWAYENMYVKNPGSYDYYPLAGIFAAACLLAFLLGYRTGISPRRSVSSVGTWAIQPLRSIYWFYLTILVVITFLTMTESLPSILTTTFKEFIPTAYAVLAVLGFAIRGFAGQSAGRTRHPAIYATSIVLPFLFFVVCNRRFYALSMLVLHFVLSHTLGAKWRLKHYAISLLSAALAYLTTTVVLRQPLSVEEADPDAINYQDFIQNIKQLPGALHRILSFSPQDNDATVDSLTRDSQYRMAGLEEVAGMFAARARSEASFSLGECNYISVLKMIPRMVWSSKPRFGWAEGDIEDEELFIVERFKLIVADQLSTPIAAAYADFNWFGALACMAVAGYVIGYTCLRLHGGQLTIRSIILVAPYSFSFFMFFERNFLQWLVHPLRNLLIVYALVLVVDHYCGVRISEGKPFSKLEG